jgi:hypothetical protein
MRTISELKCLKYIKVPKVMESLRSDKLRGMRSLLQFSFEQHSYIERVV